ncbi:arylsulfatase G [Phyllostomus discolor]|uniref:Arylsulfatase G n=1 Tax=Phyllostomus discolor TaxID=89673 RepID=A0A834DU09_9CHIR|nr:arylsulfatase G [Phyllostomus discolor]
MEFLLLRRYVNGLNQQTLTPIFWMSECIIDQLTIGFPSLPLPAFSRRKPNSLLRCCFTPTVGRLESTEPCRRSAWSVTRPSSLLVEPKPVMGVWGPSSITSLRLFLIWKMTVQRPRLWKQAAPNTRACCPGSERFSQTSFTTLPMTTSPKRTTRRTLRQLPAVIPTTLPAAAEPPPRPTFP